MMREIIYLCHFCSQVRLIRLHVCQIDIQSFSLAPEQLQNVNIRVFCVPSTKVIVSMGFVKTLILDALTDGPSLQLSKLAFLG